ncbi:MAG: type transport system ATP-binding protein [Solirubrobacteraceae bacterium]|jgi:ABC-type polysaccharide/polyol phosphate transport system ATPase subunit|nr:type transport system ATP-binding protein [Solirubrobacteraceae bacterium]
MPSVEHAPVVIEARGVEKTFHIPHQRMDTFRERAMHPLARGRHRELHALRGISFDIHQGEFFGIVGRNGSGKSTLLKIMASVYRLDAGRIRVAGRLAPFIELGVGFDPELTSRENVVLNGVIMGLGRREAQRRLDSVLDFAELREFSDLKLKNYSSGMMVRLAFAVMVEADADIMLVDEVLAVGDASFAQKCMDVFRAKRSAGRTVVLVTHDMAAVQSFCDRAMLIHDGEQRYLGDPEETALRYYRLNFGGGADSNGSAGGVPDVNVRVADAWLEDGQGERVENVEQGEPIGLSVVFEARHDLEGPVFGFHFVNADGVPVFGFNRTLPSGDGAPDRVAAGQRVRIAGRIENPLLPGRYFVSCLVSRNRTQGDLALHVVRLLDFFVYGTRPGPGSVSVKVDVEAGLEP